MVAGAIMKKIELITSIKKQHELNSGKSSVILTVFYLAGMSVFIPFATVLEDNGFYAILFFLLFFGYLIGFPTVWLKIKGVKKVKLQCQSCKSNLNNVQIQIAIASNNCPICGKTIFTQKQQH